MTTLADPPIADLVMTLKEKHRIQRLVETGTFEGDSTRWAAERFEVVYTIEICEDYQNLAREHCADYSNITFLLGDTRTCLQFVMSILEGPSLFWLDAHAAPGLFGWVDDWPILEELLVIERSPHHHVILIDDAHCFMDGTPHPACPPLRAVKDWARASGYETEIVDDVIVLIPVF